MKNELEKAKTLKKYLGIKIDEIKTDGDGFEIVGSDERYLVLTDQEANEAVKEYIKESICYFNASYIAIYSRLSKEVIEHLQEKHVAVYGGQEEINDLLIRELTIDFNRFVINVIEEDGRGHFLSSYDGDEHETGDFYIYQID